MKQILGKIGQYLYLKYGQPDFAAMTRAQLWGRPKETNFKKLSDEEQKIITADCSVLDKNPSFHFVVNEIINEMVQHIAYEANNEMMMLCDRFTINGVSLLEERIKKYSAMVEQPEEPFDKHEIL